MSALKWRRAYHCEGQTPVTHAEMLIAYIAYSMPLNDYLFFFFFFSLFAFLFNNS